MMMQGPWVTTLLKNNLEHSEARYLHVALSGMWCGELHETSSGPMNTSEISSWTKWVACSFELICWHRIGWSGVLFHDLCLDICKLYPMQPTGFLFFLVKALLCRRDANSNGAGDHKKLDVVPREKTEVGSFWRWMTFFRYDDYWGPPGPPGRMGPPPPRGRMIRPPPPVRGGYRGGGKHLCCHTSACLLLHLSYKVPAKCSSREKAAATTTHNDNPLIGYQVGSCEVCPNVRTPLDTCGLFSKTV